MKKHPSAIIRACAGFGLLLLVAGCETVPLEPSPDFVGDTVVVTDYAQFFRLGPQQAGGADLSLRTGERVMLQRKEFGYSRVQLEDGQVGYMANEEIQPAPPEPRRKRGLQRGDEPKRGKRGAQTYEEDIDEDIALPDPNLDIMPEDVPLEPLPDLQPSSVEKPARTPTKVPVPGPPPEPVREVLPESAPQTTPPVSTST